MSEDNALYSVAVGNLPLNPRKLKKISDMFKTLPNLAGFTPDYPRGTLLYFTSENAAKIGRNLLEAKGCKTGGNICRFVIAADGVPEFDIDWAQARGMMEGE